MSAQNNNLSPDLANLKLRLTDIPASGRANVDGGQLTIVTNGIILTLEGTPAQLAALGYANATALGQALGGVPVPRERDTEPAAATPDAGKEARR